MVFTSSINPFKSEAITFFSPSSKPLQTLAESIETISVSGSPIKLQTSIKNLAVYLDSILSFDKQVSESCKASYFHIRALCHIRSSLTNEAAKTVASALVHGLIIAILSLLAHLFPTWPASSFFRIPSHALWPKSLASIISHLFCLSCTGLPFVTE